MNVCTIVAKNYLAHARVLARSLQEQHPDSRLTVLVLDDVDGYVDPAQEPFRLLGPGDIGCEPFARMAISYNVLELSTAVKPWLLRMLLDEDDHAVYLDPDIQILAPLDEVRERALEHGIVLTPHNLTPIPRDGRYPTEESILIAGAYNLGFIGLGRNAVAQQLLDWWAERLETDCVVDPASGRFVDQKWIDLVPGIWPSTHLLRDPAYNIAYWNLHARRLEQAQDGRLTIEGSPVRFLHFSGYDPTRPGELSKHQDRILLGERPDVRAAADAYGQALLEEGFEETTRWPYSIAGAFPSGGTSVHDPGGVNVVGYLNAELGVGEVGRQAIAALDTYNVPVMPVGVSTGVTREAHPFQHAGHPAGPFGVNLICVNADMLPTVAGELGPEFFKGRRTIGWWWWEVDRFPEAWSASFELVDEVWAGSRFVAENLARVSPVPVAHIPTPVTMRPGVVGDRGHFGLDAGFVFLFVFDCNSVMARKNPLGLIEAFRRAFPEPGRSVSLLLKTINGDRHPEAVEQLRTEIGERDDIRLLDGFLDGGQRDVLIASCDCYISLHRSEGFGITLAEAMLLGRPVIGTAYSGSADYLSDQTGFVVDHTLVPIGEDAQPYPADGVWAEPDLDHAARLMRQVVADPDEARVRAMRGQAFIREHHSPQAAGRAMTERLARLAAPTDLEPAVDRPAALAAQEARTQTLDLVSRPVDPPVSRPGRVVEHATARITRRAAARQREINEALWWCVESQARAMYDLEQRLRHIEGRAEAAGLADRRRVMSAETLRQTLNDLRLEERLPPLLDLRAAADAEPYMNGTPFDRFDVDGAGRVLGFRDGGVAPPPADGDYHAFEDVFRGSEEMIRERQRTYLPLLRDHGPVLDAGCGRGELLDLLREEGIAASGVDTEQELVAYCHSKGHEAVEHGDAIGHLEGLAPASLGAICSMQVVEHLEADALERLLRAAHAALRPGGPLILETVNPHSPWALKAFWVDLTHQQPIFPEVLLQLCRAAGFAEAYAFAPHGDGVWDRDRTTSGEYAVVARR